MSNDAAAATQAAASHHHTCEGKRRQQHLHQQQQQQHPPPRTPGPALRCLPPRGGQNVSWKTPGGNEAASASASASAPEPAPAPASASALVSTFASASVPSTEAPAPSRTESFVPSGDLLTVGVGTGGLAGTPKRKRYETSSPSTSPPMVGASLPSREGLGVGGSGPDGGTVPADHINPAVVIGGRSGRGEGAALGSSSSSDDGSIGSNPGRPRWDVEEDDDDGDVKGACGLAPALVENGDEAERSVYSALAAAKKTASTSSTAVLPNGSAGRGWRAPAPAPGTVRKARRTGNVRGKSGIKGKRERQTATAAASTPTLFQPSALTPMRYPSGRPTVSIKYLPPALTPVRPASGGFAFGAAAKEGRGEDGAGKFSFESFRTEREGGPVPRTPASGSSFPSDRTDEGRDEQALPASAGAGAVRLPFGTAPSAGPSSPSSLLLHHSTSSSASTKSPPSAPFRFASFPASLPRVKRREMRTESAPSWRTPGSAATPHSANRSAESSGARCYTDVTADPSVASTAVVEYGTPFTAHHGGEGGGTGGGRGACPTTVRRFPCGTVRKRMAFSDENGLSISLEEDSDDTSPRDRNNPSIAERETEEDDDDDDDTTEDGDGDRTLNTSISSISVDHHHGHRLLPPIGDDDDDGDENENENEPARSEVPLDSIRGIGGWLSPADGARCERTAAAVGKSAKNVPAASRVGGGGVGIEVGGGFRERTPEVMATVVESRRDVNAELFTDERDGAASGGARGRADKDDELAGLHRTKLNFNSLLSPGPGAVPGEGQLTPQREMFRRQLDSCHCSPIPGPNHGDEGEHDVVVVVNHGDEGEHDATSPESRSGGRRSLMAAMDSSVGGGSTSSTGESMALDTPSDSGEDGSGGGRMVITDSASSSMADRFRGSSLMDHSAMAPAREQRGRGEPAAAASSLLFSSSLPTHRLRGTSLVGLPPLAESRSRQSPVPRGAVNTAAAASATEHGSGASVSSTASTVPVTDLSSSNSTAGSGAGGTAAGCATKSRKARPMPDMSAFDVAISADVGDAEDSGVGSDRFRPMDDGDVANDPALGAPMRGRRRPPLGTSSQRSPFRLPCPPTPVRTPAAFFNRCGSLGATKVLAACPPQVLDGLSSLENSLMEDAADTTFHSKSHQSEDLFGSRDRSRNSMGENQLGTATSTLREDENAQSGRSGEGGGAASARRAPAQAHGSSFERTPSDEGNVRSTASVVRSPTRTLFGRVTKTTPSAALVAACSPHCPFPSSRDESAAATGSFGTIGSVVSFVRDFDNLGILGSGAFADVYKARCRVDGCLYAVKRNRRQFRGKRDRDRSLTEFLTMQLLQSDGVDGPRGGSFRAYLLKFIRAWQEDGYFFCQTELCCRDTCSDVLRNLSPTRWDIVRSMYPSLERNLSVRGEDITHMSRLIPESTILKICHDVSAGLSHIHSRSIVHFDIKPSNIFFVSHARLGALCKIGDFGMAGEAGTPEDGGEGDTVYMAPELLDLNAVMRPSADVFSLGLMLYELSSAGWIKVWRDAKSFLPADGPRWHEIRSGAPHIPDLPPCRSASLAGLIRAMIAPHQDVRPTAEQILERHKFIHEAGVSVDTFLAEYVRDAFEIDRDKEKREALSRRSAHIKRCTPTTSLIQAIGSIRSEDSEDGAGSGRSREAEMTPTPNVDHGFFRFRSGVGD